MASGRQIQRSADRICKQDGPGRRRFPKSDPDDEERLGANAVAVQWPIGEEDSFRGMVDLITMKAYIYTDDLGTKDEEADIPEELAETAAAARENLLEALAEIDEEIMRKYIEGEPVSGEEIKRPSAAVCSR